MRKLIVLLLLIISTVVNADTLEGGRGLLFGSDHSFSAIAADNWILDNQSGVSQGIHMAFYPEGYTWTNSPVILYGRSVSKEDHPTISSLINFVVSDFHANGSPDFIGREQKPMVVSDQVTAKVYIYEGDQWGNVEAVAYFEEEETINYLVFNARSSEAFNLHSGGFVDIAKSYENWFYRTSQREYEALKQQDERQMADEQSKAYQDKVTVDMGPFLAAALRGCANFLDQEEYAPFTLFTEVAQTGEAIISKAWPLTSLSICINGMLPAYSFPAHDLEHYVYAVKLKID